MKPLRDLLLRDDLGGARWLVERIVGLDLEFHSQQSIAMNCDWRVAIENALEHAHIGHVHPETLAKLGLKYCCFKRYDKHSLGHYIVTNPRAVNSFERMRQYFDVLRYRNEYVHLYLYPYTTLSGVGGFTYSLQHYFPTETGTVLLTRLYSSRVRAGSPALGFFFDNAAKFNRQVFEEDARLCEKIHLRCVGQQMRPALQRLFWFAQARNEDANATIA